LNLLNVAIPVYKLKIIARLIGALCFTTFYNEDEYLLEEDIQLLGFNRTKEKEKKTFDYFLHLMKGDAELIPKWIYHGEKSIQREFLSVVLCNFLVVSALPKITINLHSKNSQYINEIIISSSISTFVF
jgi:hypothetical protein